MRIDLRRLLAGLALVTAVLLPIYLLVLREDADSTIEAARLLETPRSGDGLAVAVEEGALAPDFEVPAPDGSRIRLSELRGRAVLINFWATWCGSCLSEMPDIKALQQELGVETFAVLAVNAGESRHKAQAFIDFLDAPFIYGLDADLVVTDAYGVYGLPLTVFIDATGVIRAVYRGHALPPQLETLTRAAIDAEPPGELPVTLRLVSTIIRERVVTLSSDGAGRLSFVSKTLRCDASYCAEAAVAAVAGLAGVGSTDYTGEGARPRLDVRFDPSLVTQEAIAAALVAALEANPDPLYDQPLELRFEAG